MNKIFKTIIILSLIVNFGFSSDSSIENIYKNDRDLEHLIRGINHFNDIKSYRTSDNFFKKVNTFVFIKTFGYFINFKQKFCNAKIDELIAQVQGMLMKELNEEICPELREMLTSDLENLSNIPSALKELKEELQKEARLYLIRKLINRSGKNPIKSEFSREELEDLEEVAMHEIDELIVGYTNDVLKLDENSNLKEELGEDLFILIPDMLRYLIKGDFSSDSPDILKYLIKVDLSSDSIDLLKKLSVERKEEMYCEQANSINTLKKLSTKWKEEMYCEQDRFEKILKENKFDLNAEYDYLVHKNSHVCNHYSGYLIYPIFRRFCQCFKSIIKDFELLFPDISIFDKILENNKVIIRSDGINKILESFCEVFYHDYGSVPFQIRGSKVEALALFNKRQHINKLLGYVEGFIDNSPSLNIKLPDCFYSPNVIGHLRDSYNSLKGNDLNINEILEKRIQDKKDKFFNDLIHYIDSGNILEINRLLNSLNNEDADSFYEDNKDNENFKNYINKFHNISCDNNMLIETISYLKNNSLELAIRRVLINRFNEFFAEELNDYYESISNRPDFDIIKNFNTIEMYYGAMLLVLKNGSVDELLCFLPRDNYLLLAKNHFSSHNQGVEISSDKPFLIDHYEYNPIYLALKLNNHRMANDLIHDPDLLLDYKELQELSRIHNKSDAVENDIRKGIKNATNIDATDEEIQKEILSFDMAAVNFNNLFAQTIKFGKFDIAYFLLEEFSNDINKYNNLSVVTADSLMEIAVNGLDKFLQEVEQFPISEESQLFKVYNKVHNLPEEDKEEIKKLEENFNENIETFKNNGRFKEERRKFLRDIFGKIKDSIKNIILNDKTNSNRYLSKEELEIIYKSDEIYTGPESSNNGSSVNPQVQDSGSYYVSSVGNPYSSKILILLDTIKRILFDVK